MRTRTLWILAKPGETRFFAQPREYSKEFLEIQRKDGYEVFEVTVRLPERYDTKAEKVPVTKVKDLNGKKTKA